MAKKLYEESNIQAIADAIREKNGQSARYKVAEMADAILVLNAASCGSAQSATGTMAGSGSNDMSFSVDFEPDLVCVCVSDLNAMQEKAHMAGAIIVRDLFAQCAYRRAFTTAFTNGSFGYDVTGLVRSTALQASYSGGVCTVHAVQGSYKFISDCEYTWTAIKFQGGLEMRLPPSQKSR